VVRARLAQAFGRLIRRAGDTGTFVLLSSATPSRLLSAFPPGVAIRRVSLAEALERVSARLSIAGPLVHGAAPESLPEEA
jgi:ATP-dependent DNA helicase DinG